jgi:predicted nucleic acid-binding protein
MKDKVMLVYVDTSVFGGAFDDEFAQASRGLFDEIRTSRFDALVSSVVLDELRDAPQQVRRFYTELGSRITVAELSQAALELVRHYIAAGIVSERWRPDALHVAMATVSGCRAIVSWNFRHIVHFEKIPLYNGVNMSQGFGPLAIHTPQEMVHYEDEDQRV